MLHWSMVFMDILMPTMDGIETRYNMLLKLPELQSAFVAFSASAFDEQRNAYLQAGFDAVISKPFRIEQLLHCLQDLLQLQFEAPKDVNRKACFDGVTLTTEMRNALIEFAKYYNVTQLKRLLDKIAAESESHAELAGYLRQLTEQHRLDELIDVVIQL